MAGSVEVAGIRVDHGSHRLHPSTDPRILAELRALLGDDLQTRLRHGRLRLGGRWVAFPLRAGDLVRRLPPRFAVGAARDALTGPFRRAGADTFAAEVRAGLGPTVSAWFYEPYARKLWGLDAAELSGELARRRVSARRPTDVLRRLAQRRADRVFLYPRGGFGRISEAICGAAVDAGVDLRLGAPVSRLDLGVTSSRVVLDDGTAIDAGKVWSTAPAPALVRMAQPEADPALVRAIESLEHRAMVLAYLVLDRSRYTEFDAHYFPAVENPVSRLSEPRNYRDDPDEPSDRTVLCAEIPCWRSDPIWEAEPAAVGARVRRALVAEGLPDPDPVAIELRHLPRVYPVHRPGTADALAAVEAWVERHAGLVTFGRQGLFVPDNTHHALAMGWAAADALQADGSFDRAAWRQARDGFRGHVVED